MKGSLRLGGCRVIGAAAALTLAVVSSPETKAAEPSEDMIRTAQFVLELESRGRALGDPYLLIAAARLRTAAGLTDPGGALLDEAQTLAGDNPTARQAVEAARAGASRAPFKPMIQGQTPEEPVRGGGEISRTIRIGPGKVIMAISVFGDHADEVRGRLIVEVRDPQGRVVSATPPATPAYMSWPNSTGGRFVVKIRNRAARDGRVQVIYVHEQ